MGGEKKEDDAVKEESKADEEMKKEEEEVKKEEDEPLEPPKAELTEEEMKIVFKKSEVSDLLPKVLNTAYSMFELPSKDEGFAEIQYVWDSETKAQAYFKNWMLEKKRTTRLD